MPHWNYSQIYYFTGLLLILLHEKLFDLFSVHPTQLTVFTLNVPILSARENFAKRQAIRDSWFKQIHLLNQLARGHKLSLKVNPHFVIGTQACLISPIDREDIYACLPRNYTQFTSNNNDTYSKIWAQKMNILSDKLAEEANTFDDIVFVNIVDVYRNLPEKLLLYFQQYVGVDNDVTHVLKTDDDCYVNIFSVVELLLKNYKQKFTWFGNFRKNWPVNYYGKWADHSYSSPIYPQFACGSGYILTRDLVDWLILNVDYLHRYQGEDVSLGIWMSSIAPKMIQDKKWLCGEEPSIDYWNFLSAPQFTPEAMIRTHSLWHQQLIRHTGKINI